MSGSLCQKSTFSYPGMIYIFGKLMSLESVKVFNLRGNLKVIRHPPLYDLQMAQNVATLIS